MWVWMKGSSENESGGMSDVDPGRDAHWAERGCLQMALGTQGQWRRAPCTGRHPALCEKGVSGETEVKHGARYSFRNVT